MATTKIQPEEMLAFTKTSEIVNANHQELRDKKYEFVKSEEESKVGGCKT